MKKTLRILAITAVSLGGAIAAGHTVEAFTNSGSCHGGMTCMWENGAAGSNVIETDGALLNFTLWHFLVSGNVLNDNDVTNQNFTASQRYVCHNINVSGGTDAILNVGATYVFSPASSASGSSLNNNPIAQPCG